MELRHRIDARLAGLAATLGLLLPGSPSAQDDTAFFASREPPNVMLVFDTSGSMRTVVEHPFFDAADWPYQRVDDTGVCDVIPDDSDGSDINDDTTPTAYETDVFCSSGNCWVRAEPTDVGYTATPDTTDDSNHGYLTRTFCGVTRKLWIDGAMETVFGDRTWYDHKYIEWLFSLDPTETYTHPDPDDSSTMTGQEILDDIDNAINGRDFITGDYYPLYQRSRMTAAHQVAIEVMYRTNTDCPAYGGDCGVSHDRVRFGVGRFRSDNNGGWVAAAPDTYASNRTTLETTINGLRANGGTPLGETLYHIYLYFLSRGSSSDRPEGANDATKNFPIYQFRLSDGEYDPDSGDWAPDPWGEDCQRQFVIILTDGSPTADDFATSSDDEDHGFSDFFDLVGDYAPDLAGEADWDPSAGAWTTSNRGKEEGSPPWDSSSGAGYLDDIALFMHTVDARNDIDGDQFLDIYTVGFRTSGAVNDLLVKTARNGNGLAFLANEPMELTEGLVEAIADIKAKTQSFTSATVPASRATDGNNFFATYFEPVASAPFWAGHVKLFEFNARGEIRNKPTAAQEAAGDPGDCALEDPQDPNRCQIGRVRVELSGYWDAANEIPAPLSRNLYFSKFSTPPSPPISLPDQGGLDFTVVGNLDNSDIGLTIGDYTAYTAAGHDISGIASLEDAADVVQKYVAGCEFSSAAGCTDRGDSNKLWDIFHSNPVVVGPPNRGLNESTYRDFVQQYKHRKRVIYAGSNGGFLHGFNAGEYRESATADFDDVPGFDRGDGVEEMGFMPYPARERIREIPAEHGFLVDGSPQAADVWLYENGDTQPGEHSSYLDWEEWRTVLVSGMRQGGRVVFALDVTDPPDFDDAGGESTTIDYPEYMWEFPCEPNIAACNGSELPSGFVLSDYMGETWSDPVITRVKVTVDCNETDVSLCETFDRWVAIFGAGYDPQGDPNLAHDATGGDPSLYDSSNASTTSRAGRAVFMVDITSGEVLAMKYFHHSSGAPAGDTEMKYAFAAAPAVFDIDRDDYADVVYFTDLGGQVWKWVINEPAPDPINGSLGSETVDQPSWPFLRYFQADSCTSGTPHYRSFFYPPTGALVGSKLWLAFGSGERQDLEFQGTRPCEKNRFYVMTDPDPLEKEPPMTDPRPYDETVLADADSLTGACNLALPSDKLGFWLEGVQGEKFITESVIFFGVVLTGSFVPTTSTDPCDTAGDAYLYAFKLFCGAGIFEDPDSPGSTLRSVQIGTGLPTRPRVSVGPPDSGGGGGGDCSDMVVVITSDGEGFTDCPGGRPNSGINQKSWRDF